MKQNKTAVKKRQDFFSIDLQANKVNDERWLHLCVVILKSCFSILDVTELAP